jgi:hypothetical protein
LANLVEALLSINQGFDVLAGAITITIANHKATVRITDYATNFIRASGMLRRAFAESVTVFPFFTVASKTLWQLGQ